MENPSESLVLQDNAPPSRYHVKNPGGEWLDFYDIWGGIRIGKPYQIGDSAIEHAAKKLYAAGERSGGKSRLDDIKEARWSLDRAIEQIERDTSQNKTPD